jgi:8-oxo-dGTP pyrophosphatase MutT (NUDIX family)
MSFFQKIRDFFGVKTEIQDSPLETLQKIVSERKSIEDEINKAQENYSQVDEEFHSLIQKSESDVSSKAFLNKLELVTNSYLELVSNLSDSLKHKKEEEQQLEAELLAKAIQITAAMSEADQGQLDTLLKVWEMTGVVEDEECDTKIKAISKAIEVVLTEDYLEKAKGVVESKKYKGHYANAIVKNEEGKILFLKRANDKVIAPGKYCLPGGHIDEDETIEEAGLRELKEEAGLCGNYGNIAGKAKCQDGKWAFYMYVHPEDYAVKLLDGESAGMAWMDEVEWQEADLLFDLKDHLTVLECRSEIDIKYIPEIKKAEDIFADEERDVLIKGKAAGVGEKRIWNKIEYVKGKDGKWIKTKSDKDHKKKEKDKNFKHSTEQLVSHAENTSTEQLTKIANDESKSVHVRDAAKREIERRSEDKEKEKRKWDRDDKVRTEDQKNKKQDHKREKEKAEIEERRKKQNEEEEERKKKLDESLPVGTEITFEATSGMSNTVKRFSGKIVAHESDGNDNLLYDVRWQEGDKSKRRLVDPKWIISSKEVKKSDDDNDVLEKAGKHYEYVRVERAGKVFFQYREVGSNKVEDEIAIGDYLDSELGLKISKYSDKAFLITGDTFKNLELLRKLKSDVGIGSWNKTLNGWIFPYNAKEKVLATLIPTMPDGTFEETKAKEEAIQMKNAVDPGTHVTVDGKELEVKAVEATDGKVGYEVDGNVVPESSVGIVPTSQPEETLSNVNEENRFKSGKEFFGKEEGEAPISESIEKDGQSDNLTEKKEFETRSGEKVEALDYTGIRQMDIQLVDQDDILDKPKPNWCADINLPVLAGVKNDKFVFDYVKMGDDQYLLALNGFETGPTGWRNTSGHEISNKDLRDDLKSGKYTYMDLELASVWGNSNDGYHIKIGDKDYAYSFGDKENVFKDNDALQNNHHAQYAVVSLDQIVAMQDYYQKFAKAIIVRKKEIKTQEVLERMKTWDDAKIQRYYPFDYDKRLSDKQRKKYTKEEWDALPKDLKIAEVPFMKHPAVELPAGKRISQLADNRMKMSNFDMYKKFVDKKYLTPKDKNSRYYDSGTDPCVIEYNEVRDQLQWRKVDMQLQREENDSSYEKGFETSYGESNTKTDLLGSHGVKVKLQNGKEIKANHTEQIKDHLSQVYESFGNRSRIAKEVGLKISHSGEKMMFARQALGLYVPSMKSIGVSDNKDHGKFGLTLAHEFAHFMDNYVGNKNGRHYASDNLNSIAGKIANTFRHHLNEKSDSNYLNRTCECFARALEQYHAVRTGGDGAIKSQKDLIPYSDRKEHVSNEKFNKYVKPLIEQFFKENEELLKASIDELNIIA